MDEEIFDELIYLAEHYKRRVKENQLLLKDFPQLEDLEIRIEENKEFIEKLEEVLSNIDV